MQKCTHCGSSHCDKGVPSIHVLDVEGGQVVDTRFLCPYAAEELGILHARPAPMTLSTEILENLLGGLKPKSTAVRDTECPGCGTTFESFKVKGRVGCPRCYDTFRVNLLGVLERVHDAAHHQGRCPPRSANSAPDPVNLTELRELLQSAIADERYEEAAQLRDQLQRLTSGDSAPEETSGS